RGILNLAIGCGLRARLPRSSQYSSGVSTRHSDAIRFTRNSAAVTGARPTTYYADDTDIRGQSALTRRIRAGPWTGEIERATRSGKEIERCHSLTPRICAPRVGRWSGPPPSIYSIRGSH